VSDVGHTVAVSGTALSDAEVAITAASAGAAEVRARYGQPVERFAKQGTDFATSADLASEAAIRAVVTAHRPDDAMIGEEDGRSGPDDAAREWLVDPLCGTRNFAAITPLVAVNVALLDDSGDVAAASADPVSGEVFWTDASSAWVRRDGTDTPLAPSARSLLVDLDLDHPDGGDSFHLISLPAFLRDYQPRVSSTTLAMTWLADGRRAGYLHEGDLRENVHFAAPVAIARAAGCVITGIHGQPLDVAPYGLLAAADPATHAALLALLLDR
jgi:myo-inositol-1(or 4)-monophosphatase